jgi:hypothetical protein
MLDIALAYAEVYGFSVIAVDRWKRPVFPWKPYPDRLPVAPCGGIVGAHEHVLPQVRAISLTKDVVALK